MPHMPQLTRDQVEAATVGMTETNRERFLLLLTAVANCAFAPTYGVRTTKPDGTVVEPTGPYHPVNPTEQCVNRLGAFLREHAPTAADK